VQAFVDDFVSEAVLEYVRVCNECFEAKLCSQSGWCDWLNTWVYDWEEKWCFHCRGFRFQFSDSCKEVFFSDFEAQCFKPKYEEDCLVIKSTSFSLVRDGLSFEKRLIGLNLVLLMLLSMLQTQELKSTAFRL